MWHIFLTILHRMHVYQCTTKQCSVCIVCVMHCLSKHFCYWLLHDYYVMAASTQEAFFHRTSKLRLRSPNELQQADSDSSDSKCNMAALPGFGFWVLSVIAAPCCGMLQNAARPLIQPSSHMICKQPANMPYQQPIPHIPYYSPPLMVFMLKNMKFLYIFLNS